MLNTLRLTLCAVLLAGIAACQYESSPVASTPSLGADATAAPEDPAASSAVATSPSAEALAANVDVSLPGGVAARGAPDTAYWPRFHGPNGDNVSPDTGLIEQWPEEGPELAWTVKGLGHGFSSVAMAGGLIYTAGNVDEKTKITALDADGEIQWQVENGNAWTSDPPGSRGTPTIDDGRLYHESPLGEVVCLNAKTGERIWGLNILQEFEAKNITWALAESVLIDGDHVICCPGGDRASVVALDKMTGKTVWEARGTGDKAGYASPVLAEHQGMRMILTMTAKALIGVNADNGDFLFRYEHITEYDVNATDPIFRDGRIFISSGYGSGSELLELTVDGGKARVEQVWQSKDLDNHHGGVILLDGYLYGASSHAPGRGRWICLNWDSGKTMYLEKGVGKGSATYADGMLYTFSENRDMGLVKATPSGHEVISRFRLPSGGTGKSWAHPVVCGGRLYLRHSDQLWAYEVRAKR